MSSISNNSPFNDFPNLSKQHDTTVFQLCNEKHRARTLVKLGKYPKIPESLHFGFSCWANYDIMAERQSKYGILCDISPAAIKYLDELRNMILLSSDLDSFIKLFRAEFYEAPLICKTISEEKNRPRYWVGDGDKFLYIQKMYKEGRIKHVQLNMSNNTGMFSKINDFIKQKGWRVDTIYTSNVREWIATRRMKKSFYINKSYNIANENLKLLIVPETIFIEAQRRVLRSKVRAVQSLTVGGMPEITYVKKRAKQGTGD